MPSILAGRRGENWCVDEGEPSSVEILPARLGDFAPDTQDRVLAGRPEPEVPMVEEERDPMFLGCDDESFGALDDRDILRTDFVADRRTGVGAHSTRHGDRGFLAEMIGSCENVGRYVGA